MTMTTGEKQRLFTKLIGQLIDYSYKAGWELTFGDAYRDPRLAVLNAIEGKGIVHSLHSNRLAVDFNLFKDGKYLFNTEDYRLLGEFWEALDPLCCWGGRFSKPDGNHFSITDGGIK